MWFWILVWLQSMDLRLIEKKSVVYGLVLRPFHTALSNVQHTINSPRNRRSTESLCMCYEGSGASNRRWSGLPSSEAAIQAKCCVKCLLGIWVYTFTKATWQELWTVFKSGKKCSIDLFNLLSFRLKAEHLFYISHPIREWSDTQCCWQ